jgi:hypothetical protein
MSKFLSNLAARSLGAFDAIAPRVPSRFEPMRKADGLLAGRAPSREEGLREIREMEGTAGVEAPAADPTGDGSRSRRRARPTGPMDSSLLNSEPSPSSSEPEPGTWSIRPAASIAPNAESRETSFPSEQPASRVRRIPGSQSAGFSTPGPNQANVDRPLDPASAFASPPALTPALIQRRDTKSRGSHDQGTPPIQSAQASRRSSPAADEKDFDTLDSDFGVSASVGTPGQIDEAPALGVPISQQQMHGPASGARDRARSGEARHASFPPAEPARAGESSQDDGPNEAQAATSAGRGWPGDIDRKFGLKPDRSIVPAARQETATRTESLTATRAGSAELASAAARPADPNPASQPLAGAAAEPAIRVTIGRVEVRAVFPEQAAKRTPPPRFKPRVSLDDYLSRGSGGRR